jgi:hypothetical protein
MWCLEVMLKMNTPEAVQKSQALARRLNRISPDGSKEKNEKRALLERLQSNRDEEKGRTHRT